MKNKEFKILSFDKTIILKSIQIDDIEKIRIWKNENKNSFFYKKDISKPEQLVWFKKYIKTVDDYIFIIKYLVETVGCIGFRKIENDIDIYNVILRENKYKSIEKEVFTAIQNIAKTKTLIIIAHRLTTIKECDVIYVLKNGSITGIGKYDELIETNENFKKIAGVKSLEVKK